MVNRKIKSRGVAPIIVGQHTINNAIKGELCKFWKRHNCLRGQQCKFQHRCVATVTKIKIPKQETNLVTFMVTQVISLDPEMAAKYVIENRDKAIGIILDDYQLLAPTKEVVNDCRKKRAEWPDLERIFKKNIDQKQKSERIEEFKKRKKSPTKLSSIINQKQLEKKKLKKKLKNQKRKQKIKQKKNLLQMDIEEEKIKFQKNKQLKSIPIPSISKEKKEIRNAQGQIQRVSKIDSLTLYQRNEQSFTDDSIWDTHSEISNTSSKSVFSYKELKELHKEIQQATQLNPPKEIDWNTLQPKSQEQIKEEMKDIFNSQIISLNSTQSQNKKKGTNSDKLKQTVMTDYKK
ncbi:hypothetical protein ABPG72_018600 [Tetrahymena utriculariae]